MRLGIRQQEISAALGVHRNKVWGWEDGNEQLPKWADVLLGQYLRDADWVAGIKAGRPARKPRQRRKF